MADGFGEGGYGEGGYGGGSGATQQDYNTNIRRLIRVALGMAEGSVREANKNNPTLAANVPFATVLVSDYGTRGWDDVIVTTEPGDDTTVIETVIGQRDLTASIQFFRQGALTLALRLKTVLQQNSNKVLSRQLGLGLTSVGRVRNLSQVVDTYWEERSQVDVVFTVMAVEIDTIGTYNEFPVNVIFEE